MEVHARAYLAEKRGEESTEKPTADLVAFERALGYRLLRTDRSSLEPLRALPPVLQRLGIEIAAAALLHALGYSDELAEWVTVLAPAATLETFVHDWMSSAVPEDFVEHSNYGESETVLEARVAGAAVTVHCEGRAPAGDVGESLLGMLEALLATSAGARLMAYASSSAVRVRVVDDAADLVSHDVVDVGGRSEVVVTCRAFALLSTTLSDVDPRDLTDVHRPRGHDGSDPARTSARWPSPA